MWPEPLTPHARPAGPHDVTIAVRDGAGAEVARAPCAYNAEAGYGVFGEMRIVAAGGAPRQRLRALVLLVREALRFGAGAGVTRVSTEAPERLSAFAARMCGLDATDAGARRNFAGELHAVRTHALAESDDRGELLRASAREVEELEREAQNLEPRT